MKFKNFLQLTILLIGLTIICIPSFAKTYSVISDMLWSELSPIPGANDIIKIHGGATLIVDVMDAECAHVVVGNSAGKNPGDGTLAFDAEGSLTTNSGSGIIIGATRHKGTVDMSKGGTLKTKKISVTSNNSKFISGIGTVELDANNAIPTQIKSFYNLVVRGGITHLDSDLVINNSLQIKAGTFRNLKDSLTFYSDTNKTASLNSRGGGRFEGNMTLRRAISGNPEYRFFSAPVKDMTFEQLNDDFYTWGIPGSDDPGSSWASIYYYDETRAGLNLNGWVPISNMTDTMEVGKGYIAYIDAPDLPLVIDMTGRPNLGTYAPNLDYTITSGGILEDGWNLIGNPYPSSIDWEASSGLTRDKVDNAIYIWNTSNSQYSSYVNGFGTNDGDNIIPSAQSFWVKAGALNPSISFNIDITSNKAKKFMKVASMVSNAIKIKISGQGYSDETVIRFADGATETFDGEFDAYKLFSGNAQDASIYTIIDSCLALSVNALPELDKYSDVALGCKTGEKGTYTIQAEILAAFDEGILVFLEDTVAGTMTNLLTGGTYTFNADPNNISCGGRFIIHFEKVESGVDEIDKQSFIVYPNPSDGFLYLENFNSYSDHIDLELYSMGGQRIYKTSLTLQGGKAAVDFTDILKGTYMMLIRTDTDTQVEQIQIN